MFSLSKFLTLRKLRREQNKIKFNEKIWNQRRPLIEKQNAIDAEQKKLEIEHKRLKFPSWSKLLLIFLFINFTILEIFIGWVTIKSFAIALAIGMMPDFTPLITLIGAVIGETLSYGIYSAKYKAENTEGGIIFERQKWEMSKEYKENDEGGCG